MWKKEGWNRKDCGAAVAFVLGRYGASSEEVAGSTFLVHLASKTPPPSTPRAEQASAPPPGLLLPPFPIRENGPK